MCKPFYYSPSVGCFFCFVVYHFKTVRSSESCVTNTKNKQLNNQIYTHNYANDNNEQQDKQIYHLEIPEMRISLSAVFEQRSDLLHSLQAGRRLIAFPDAHPCQQPTNANVTILSNCHVHPYIHPLDAFVSRISHHWRDTQIEVVFDAENGIPRLN